MKTCKSCQHELPITAFARHPATRDRLQPHCRECQKKISARHYQQHRQEYVRRSVAWAKEHPDAGRGRVQRYRTRNRTAVNAKHAARKKANPQHFAELENRRRARKRGVKTETIDRRALYARDGGVCHLCGQPVAFEKMQLDHVIPLARGGEHTAANLKVAHGRCNRRKWAKSA